MVKELNTLKITCIHQYKVLPKPNFYDINLKIIQYNLLTHTMTQILRKIPTNPLTLSMQTNKKSQKKKLDKKKIFND